MRTFIALHLPREVKDEIEGIQNALREKDFFRGKFVEKENLHLTLKFLGELDEEKVEKTKELLREIKFEPFEAELGELGVFSEKFVRIVWVHLKGAEELQKKVDESLKEIFEPERRFMSHITLARVKALKDKKGLLDFLKNFDAKKIRFKVGSFYLMKSELSPEGPKYEVLEEFRAIL